MGKSAGQAAVRGPDTGLKDSAGAKGQAMWLDFLNTAKAVTLIPILVFLLIAGVILLYWFENSHKDFKLWGIEITEPESDGVKACRSMQSALHDEVQMLENDRLSSHKAIDGDSAALNALTSQRIDAVKRDREISKETQSSYHYNEQIVVDRIEELTNEEDGNNKTLEKISDKVSVDTKSVFEACSSLLGTHETNEN